MSIVVKYLRSLFDSGGKYGTESNDIDGSGTAP